MSFGAAAQRRGNRPPNGAMCHCGSGALFARCCGPILDGAPAATPEQLMRSRYSAFTVGDLAHLERTWHPSTRPAHLTPDAGVRWQRLEIVRAQEAGDVGVVEFRASWRDDGVSGVLHETSRFRRVQGHWLYVDGDVG